MILDHFCKKSSCFEGEKKFDVHFFCRKKQKSYKMTLPQESRNVNCKSQEIWSGVDWYIPYEMAVDSAKGRENPPPVLIGLK